MAFKQIRFSDLSKTSDSELAGKVIIGFDIDWASDFVLANALELARDIGITPTLFLTHQSKLINSLYKDKKYEFGLHPNFDYLLNGNDANGENSREVLKNLQQMFPSTKLIRSHSLTSGSRLKNLFFENGIKIESSFLSHGTNKIFPNCWSDFSGLTQVPITWEDDIWFTLSEGYVDPFASGILRPERLNVLTFHPIHLLLNTTDNDHYLRAKEFLNDPQELKSLRSEHPRGVRRIFTDIGATLNG